VACQCAGCVVCVLRRVQRARRGKGTRCVAAGSHRASRRGGSSAAAAARAAHAAPRRCVAAAGLRRCSAAGAAPAAASACAPQHPSACIAPCCPALRCAAQEGGGRRARGSGSLCAPPSLIRLSCVCVRPRVRARTAHLPRLLAPPAPCARSHAPRAMRALQHRRARSRTRAQRRLFRVRVVAPPSCIRLTRAPLAAWPRPPPALRARDNTRCAAAPRRGAPLAASALPLRRAHAHRAAVSVTASASGGWGPPRPPARAPAPAVSPRVASATTAGGGISEEVRPTCARHNATTTLFSLPFRHT
jgi:hypothetical protein